MKKQFGRTAITVITAIATIMLTAFLAQPASAAPPSTTTVHAVQAQVMPTSVWSGHTMQLYQAENYGTLLEVWDLNWDCDSVGYGHTVSTFWWWSDGNTASSFRLFGIWRHCNYAGIRNQYGVTKWKCITRYNPGWSLFPLNGWNDNIEWWGVKYNYHCPLF